MASILGIDLGTSSVKAMLLDINHGVMGLESMAYDVDVPSVSYAEQSPEIWWKSLVLIIKKLQQKHPKEFEQIVSIGFSGQMHGIVVLDKAGRVLRPAILWLDQRSKEQLAYIKKSMTKQEMAEVFHNDVFTGYAFPSLLWIRDNEPEVFEKIDKIMQPKDYIRYKVTGIIGMEVSDASSTLMFDPKKRVWAKAIIQRFKLPQNIFPKCYESTDIAGCVTKTCAKETGLKKGTLVVYGSGDQQAQSIGNGAVREGIIISNIGTGGQISTFSKKDKYDSKLRTHTFCHAIDQAYTIYGAALCSGMSLKWLKDNVLHIDGFETLSEKAGEITAGSEGVIYLPYLTGERTPHMNSKAKGMFFGIQLGHDERHLIRSVMEGVVFSLKDSLEIFEEMGIKSDEIIASGGGALSRVWLQIQADIFEKEVRVSKVKEQACLGACILAGVGTGHFSNIEEACKCYVKYDDYSYKPIKEHVERYRKSYKMYKKLYEQTKNLMQ